MSKIVVEIFGSDPPCPKCKATVKVVEEALRELQDRVEIRKHSALSPEAERYNILLTPTVVVNGKVVVSGRVPDKKEIIGVVMRELEKQES